MSAIAFELCAIPAILLPRLNACPDGRALVFANGQLAGIIAPADISRALERISGNRGPFGSAGRKP